MAKNEITINDLHGQTIILTVKTSKRLQVRLKIAMSLLWLASQVLICGYEVDEIQAELKEG